ncbi:polysaccharide deacetylase family protein [Aquibacillus albus]|uniref:Peptidoglycan/xylan/chitin deacetylase (PgdA/CDA1 family) n=1 Tax=Aquibacillus albus TaxID=1168171 RepID=A0ABS2N269_9BACI|nr:polysaccharide deacetylase family protein [Aquibacillus albus]MBM7572231.1 peptidoglycan/xylan/chitin deacetylase (PgdA/CDA1 family) [Aquibacillus albus]
MRYFSVLFVVLLFVVGCTDTNSTQGDGSQDEQPVIEKPSPKEEQTDQKEVKDEEIDQNDAVLEDDTDSEQGEVVEEYVPKYEITSNWSVRPISEDDNDQVVLLTIDDAPDKYSLEMAQTLKDLDAKAIFFVNGHFLDTEEEQKVLKQIYDMGFPIGNHTYNHASLPDISESEQKDEIIQLSDLVEEITGERPKYFRAPFGLNTDYSNQIVEEEGMVVMNWSYGYDWEQEYRTAEAIADIMVNTELLSNGSNLLMHDREWTAKGLADIVTGLRDKGYEIVNPEWIVPSE